MESATEENRGSMHASKRTELAFAGLLALALAYVAGKGIASRSAGGLFPAIIGTVGTMAAVVNIVQAVTRRGAAAAPPDAERARWLAALSIGAPLAYAVLLWLLGFWIASAATLLALPWVLEYRRPLLLLAIAAATLIGIRIVFVDVFAMHLPEGLLIERMMNGEED